MYQAPAANASHFSTSSSVYSPLESEFGFNRHTQSQEVIHEVEEEDERVLHSHNPSQSSYESFESSNQHKMNTEVSAQTFDSFRTASGNFDPQSFSSINDSLLRNPSNESLEEYTYTGHHHPNNPFDDDKTPKLESPANFTNDNVDDTTPIVKDGLVFENKVGHALPVLNNNLLPTTAKTNKSPSPQLPQQELSSKFRRLSATLQQSRASGDSYLFLTSFQQNVEKVNNDPNTKRNSVTAKNPRTSLYYKKIHEKYGADEGEVDSRNQSKQNLNEAESSVLHQDVASVVSTVSNRSSIISHDSDDHLPSGSGGVFHSNFNAVSSSHSLASGVSTKSAYYVKGSRISPKKERSYQEDEVPIRRDLVNKFEQLSPSNNISEKEKNDRFIAGKLNLSEKYPNGLNISYTDSSLDPKNLSADSSFDETQDSVVDKTTPSKIIRESASSNQGTTIDDDDDLSSLFIRALHPFDSSTLQSESDASICLSFEKDDLAFVHTIDDSGWGEVTLIESLQRGWIPMNYFAIAVTEEDDPTSENYEETEDEESEGKIPNSHYLKPLFHACGRFLMNPLSHKTRREKYTFSIRVINSIRDGVRLLLQQTDCLSRSNEIVTKRPIVRKTRKSLLADWYNLMVKANEYKGTSNFNKIEVLTLMIYQVTRKAVAFLQVWSIESKEIIKRENEKKLQSDMNNYPLLNTPPLAKQRVTEINGLLYSYLGLIIGRLDLIEHNPVGCDILESLTHHIILLLRELLFISRTGSDFSSQKPAELDNSLDALLSLVSDLVSGVKNLVVKTFNEDETDKKNTVNSPNLNGIPQDYYYTPEGGELIQIAAKMIKSLGSTIASIRKLLEITGDFKLNSERSYPDYSRMKIEPEDFIKRSTLGIAKTSIKHKDLSSLKPENRRKSNRYSIMRSGQTGNLGLTTGGATMMHDVLLGEIDGNSPFSISNVEFEPFTTSIDGEGGNIKDELLIDSNGNLLGASFKGLVFTLTNENSPPEYFFVSTFFICFKGFANGIDLIEELISRFDISNKSLRNQNKTDVTGEVKLKNRRRLIVKMFQIWMESYWNQQQDYSLLTTLINFFNEGVSLYLPYDAMKLIEIAAKLSTKPLIENQSQTSSKPINKQLITRKITIVRNNRMNSIISGDSGLTSRYSVVDGYELAKINTNSSTTSSMMTMSLPLPLGVGNQTSSSSSLLSKHQSQTIEKVNLTYRAILGNSWCLQKYIDAKSYIPLELSSILPNWFNICEQSWVLSNYRPNLLDFNGLEIAKQLTLIESHIFCAIKPEELLNENFSAKRAHLKLAPNIRQSLLFTNCLSGYVLETVLQPKINQKMRVNMIKTWLKVAISCLYLRNFNSLAAIITALQSHLITRLGKMWVDLSEKYRELYEYLSGIIHPDKNYSIYRSKLRNFLVSNDVRIPIVPYFSLFLQDLTFVAEGNPNFRKANTFLNQKLINIDKHLKLTRIIADIESLQTPYTNTPQKENKRSSLLFLSAPKNPENDDYTIIPVPALQELVLLELWKINQLNRTEEDRSWKLSCLIQPRDVTQQ